MPGITALIPVASTKEAKEGDQIVGLGGDSQGRKIFLTDTTRILWSAWDGKPISRAVQDCYLAGGGK